jgi:hypothetical protein
MTPKEAFRYGFLLRCAEENLSPEEIAARVKTASTKQAENPLTAAVNAGKSLLSWGVGGPLVGGAVIGGGLGYGLAHATNDVPDPADIKMQELMAAHRLYAEQLRQRRQMRERPNLGPQRPDFAFT